MTFDLAKAQVSAANGVPPPSNFGLNQAQSTLRPILDGQTGA
jgi:hypothetical protein